MAIHYHCRHCGTKIGSIENTALNTHQLGFDLLTSDERQDMITYDLEGNLQVKSICEDCQELLERQPEYHQNDFLIH